MDNRRLRSSCGVMRAGGGSVVGSAGYADAQFGAAIPPARVAAGVAATFALMWLVRVLVCEVPALGPGPGRAGAGGARPLGSGPHGVDLAHFVAESEWKNDLVLGATLPEAWRAAVGAWPRLLRSWLRNYIGGNLLYLACGGLWMYYAYFVWGRDLFPKGGIPSAQQVRQQVNVSLFAIPIYSLLPSLTEHVVEKGWTVAYADLTVYSPLAYLAFFIVYMALVEWMVYWMHRLLHDIRPAYFALHVSHHIYNDNNALSPMAGLAFDPIDGVLQALPYSLLLFFVPMHMMTFEMLFFATCIWTTNIHDCLDGKCEPIMGAAYHTIHHTSYKFNYGHYFIYVDQILGTLKVPKREP